MVPDASDVLTHLLKGDHSKIAGRLAGAFRISAAIKSPRTSLARCNPQVTPSTKQILSKTKSPIAFSARETSPYVNRLRMSWSAMREDVLRIFPAPPGEPSDANAYMKQIEESYAADAYNSLSIKWLP